MKRYPVIRRMLMLPSMALAAGVAHASPICPPGLPRSAPDERFVVSESGAAGQAVVRDLVTGLMWKQCSEGLSGPACAQGSISLMNWPDALATAAASTFAGFGDWRVPTTIEQRSLVEPGCMVPAINGNRFPATAAFPYWTSTTMATSPSDAWTTNFEGGDTATAGSKQFYLTAVRLVRAGSAFDDFDATADYTPDAFAMTPQTDVPPNSLRMSEVITVQGIDTVTGIRVVGSPSAAYSINAGAFVAIPGAVRAGDTVRVRHRAAAGLGAVMTTNLTIGGVSADFVTTTTDQDILFQDGFEP